MQGVRNEIQNWGSVTGAIIAEVLINKWFGLASFAFAYFGIIIGLRLIRVNVTPVWKAFFYTSFWLIWASTLLGYILYPYYKDFLFFSPGGQHGDVISRWLISYVGMPGTLMILIGTFLTYAIISSSKTIPFLKKLFTKKPKLEKEVPEAVEQEFEYNEETEEREQSVAVGTEIIPEDWVIKPSVDDFAEAEEELIIEPAFMEEAVVELNPTITDEVPFEIENQPEEANEINELPADELPANENDGEDPYYNIAKLGKYDPTLDLSHYKYPVLDLLKNYGSDKDNHIDMVEQNANKNRIITTLQMFIFFSISFYLLV
jgi:S-DNA-T family DNA segregation ATPase FtsK/SpoIIIE